MGYPQPEFRLIGNALEVHPYTFSSRFSSMKSAPVGSQSSADKWAVNPTRAIELLNPTVCTTVQTRRVVAAWVNFEALSCQSD